MSIIASFGGRKNNHNIGYNMKIEFAPMAFGKTAEMILLSAKRRAPIVCLCERERENILETSELLRTFVPMPITFHEFMNKTYEGHSYKEVIIDNADMLLQSLTSCKVIAITVTDERVQDE